METTGIMPTITLEIVLRRN
jgi:hypothetical protein